jgi:glyoxylase-like metal-dependent hydrolase (beta-lactamase superfamily II)
MRIRQAGKVTDGLWYLGREESGVYVLEGKDSSILINGGLSYIVPNVLKQMSDFGIDAGKIKKALILHSHFDHIGIVPFFKRTFPEIEVLASKRAWEILAMPKAINIANTFSKSVAGKMGAVAGIEKYDLDWRDDVTGTTLVEGDEIDLGGKTLNVMETPGHTGCSISVYDPDLKALFPSDAMGIPFKDIVFPSANTDFTQYQETLERLKPLPVNFMCADHYGYVTGEEATRFTEMTIQEARNLRAQMENVYRSLGDIDAAAKAINEEYYKVNPDYFISADILEGVFRQIVKYLAKNMQAG